MMINKRDTAAHNIAGFNAANGWGTISTRTDTTSRPSPKAHAAASNGPAALRYITPADRAYIAHDLPKPITRDVFGPTIDQEPTSGIDWEGIAIGAFLIGFLVLASIALFKIADFGAASANISAWQVFRAQ